MKIDFSQKPKTLKGDEFKVDENSSLSLGEACCEGLLAPLTDDKDFGSKSKKYKLSKKIIDGGVVEVSSEDITLIKEACGKVLSVSLYGAVEEMLENPCAEKKGDDCEKESESKA
jgi:hypothetical protein